MTETRLQVLNVEDSEQDAELSLRELERAGFRSVIERVWSAEALEKALSDFRPDLILCDFSLPGGFDGLDALAIVRGKGLDIPFILVSGTIGEERAVEALRRGATDYVLKEHIERLGPVVGRALREANERTALKVSQEALSESEERFRQLAENIRDVFFLLDARDQSMLYVSPAYEEIWGESCASLYAKPSTWMDLIHPADRERIELSNADEIREGGFDTDYRIVRRDGSVRWILARSFPILDDRGHLHRIAGVAADVTARKLAEERIRRLNRIHAVLSGINTLIVRAGQRDELLREACRIAIDPGQFRMALVGLVDREKSVLRLAASAGVVRGFMETIPPAVLDIGPDGRGLVAQVVHSGKPVISSNVQNDDRLQIDKRELAVRGIEALALIPLPLDSQVIGVLALYAADGATFDEEEMRLLTELAGDISYALDHIEKKEKLDYLAYHDALTGLPNRNLFHERVGQHVSSATREERKFAVVVIDIERFRIINDSLGRQAGDEVLKQVAARCVMNEGTTDLVARIGYDQFAVLVPDVKADNDVARVVLDWNREIFGMPFHVGDAEFKVFAKYGIALFPADGADADQVLKNSDAALQKAKLSGERYLYYTQQMNERAAEQMLLESRLQRALENDEFVWYYQPKIAFDDGHILGVEALIRWASPELGLVPPMQFIPLMEETGMILDVGAWALRQAANDFSAWRGQGLVAPRIAVNVSPVQLRQRDFVGVVEQVLSRGDASHGIDLEITESLIMEDVAGNVAKLNAIRSMGINIAIDDFGTGYSSLAYLAALPVQSLKIDRTFIITMLKDANAMTLVSTMITLAHSLGLRVIAEGVDEEEQAKVLRLLRCDEMQGYLFSKPLPFEQMTRLLEGP
jgi:diguanylate cyclase (GGDEF)-like protein/PAS domain S-box-containing protein